MQVSEVMHKGVACVNSHDSIRKVAQLMKDEDIGSVPVLENQKPVGFVTDRDIVISCVANGESIDEPISRAMTPSLFCVTENQEVEEATRIMQDNQVSRVVVVDKNQKPVGIVSLQDLSNFGFDELEADTLSGIKEQ